MSSDEIQAPRAEIVLPAGDLDTTLAFFTERLGFRLDTIFPADAPRVAVVSGHGVRVRLERAPAGAQQPLPPARAELVVSRAADAAWSTGRAGMLYRDLLPGRLGGRCVASLIRIERGGPVADWVHWHDVRFQVLYCLAGEVTVAYEDQGPPIVMRAGDTVLQPPRIRHRVIACTPGLEVLEVAGPAEHATHSDHDLVLPTAQARPEREFGGQRFVHDVAAAARWRAAHGPSTCREAGVAAATRGLADVRVLRPGGAGVASASLVPEPRAAVELRFFFVLAGGLTLHAGDRAVRLGAGDSCAVPGSTPYRFAECTPDGELLEVTVSTVASS